MTPAMAHAVHTASMAAVKAGRYTAELPDGAVMFLIGMRVNRPLRIHKWFPVAAAMPPMLLWLRRHPAAGLLSTTWCWLHGGFALIQYWRSFEGHRPVRTRHDGPAPTGLEAL